MLQVPRNLVVWGSEDKGPSHSFVFKGLSPHVYKMGAAVMMMLMVILGFIHLYGSHLT